jgi:hypothetical protein
MLCIIIIIIIIIISSSSSSSSSSFLYNFSCLHTAFIRGFLSNFFF